MSTLLSLCMPTNGILEFVVPVLDSIFSQEIDSSLYEVIITDNGNNKVFEDKMSEYLKKHNNLKYIKTTALPFLNEIESYKNANGEFIKFVNHRTILLDGSIDKLIKFVKENIDKKPVVYFSNGVLSNVGKIDEYSTFNEFVKRLSYYSSWSTGMSIWKSDFERLPNNIDFYNVLFPHTDILFNERKRGKYIVDNTLIMYEQPQGNRPKAHYDVFRAFGIEYLGIILDLLRDGDISEDTFKYVKHHNLGFIGRLYLNNVIMKQYTSYDLSGFEAIFEVFYTKTEFYLTLVEKIVWKISKEIKKKLKLKV